MIKKALIIAPEWSNKGFVGNLRLNRYLKWLKEEDFVVTLIAIGDKFKRNETEFGEEIFFKLPFYKLFNLHKIIPIPLLSKIARSLIFYFETYFLIPDRFILSRRIILKKLSDLINLSEFGLVISSSPPESSHLISHDISVKVGAKLIIDLRDGWLDEPLKTIIQNSKKREKKEKDFESKVLNRADAILVTSEEWKELLLKRYPTNRTKTKVIYNAYPDLKVKNSENRYSERTKLIYSGRFRGSSFRRTPDMIFNQLIPYIKKNNTELTIRLIGEFGRKDLKQLDSINSHLKKHSSEIEIQNLIPRKLLFKELKNSDGFLLLSASVAAVPSKLFEYLHFRKPILAFAPAESPIKRFSEYIDQIIFINIDEDFSDNENNLRIFFDYCQRKKTFVPPAEFTEIELKKQFKEVLKSLNQEN